MFDWLRAQKDRPVPSTEGGHSGYLSAPEATLDPHLFNGDLLKGSVRHALISPLNRYLTGELGLDSVTSWIRIWLAGSGITYQWDADRGNGDLDVLLGMSRARFDKTNPEYAAEGDDDLAGWLNGQLKANLWPQTSSLEFGDQTYAVTYFYSPGAGTDIRHIHPYAAIDVMSGTWVVRPPKLPHDPAQLYPQEWFESANQDFKTAGQLANRYRQHLGELGPPGTPGHVNAGARLNLVAAQAQAMFDDIHRGRQVAFQGGGQGYMDQHNFRWQMAKASGTIKALKEITGVRSRAEEQSEQELYGAKLEPAAELTRRAVAQQQRKQS